MKRSLSHRVAQALGLSSCPLSYLVSTTVFGSTLPASVRVALLCLSAAWTAVELWLGIARPARRPVANAPFVRVTRAVWLAGVWLAWLDWRHGWLCVRPPPSVQAALLAVGCLGLGLRLAAVAALGPGFTYDHSVGEGALYTSGLYRWLRHPAYAGLLILTNLLGWLLGSGLGIVALASTLPNVIQRIRAEEADLLRVYGSAYASYQTRSRRLIPWVY